MVEKVWAPVAEILDVVEVQDTTGDGGVRFSAMDRRGSNRAFVGSIFFSQYGMGASLSMVPTIKFTNK